MNFIPQLLFNTTSSNNQATDTLFTAGSGLKYILQSLWFRQNGVTSAVCRVYIERAGTGFEQTIGFFTNKTGGGVDLANFSKNAVPTTASWNSQGLPTSLPAAGANAQGAICDVNGIVLEAGDMIKVTRSGANHATQVAVTAVLASGTATYTPTHLFGTNSANNQSTDTLYTVSAGQRVILETLYAAGNAVNSSSTRVYIQRASGATQSIAWLVNHTTGIAWGMHSRNAVPPGSGWDTHGPLNSLPSAIAAQQGHTSDVRGIILEAGDMIKVTRATANHVSRVSACGIVIS